MKFIRKSLSVLIVSFLFAGVSSATLIVPVGDFQPRFRLDGAGGNGSVDSSQATAEEGIHTFCYTGPISDFLGTDADETRPFLGFDQGAMGGGMSNFAFIDNISLTIDGNDVWSEDFEGAAIGATSGNNQTLAGTVVQSANQLGLEVVAAPAGFTNGSGNVAAISTLLNNGFSAIRSSANPVDFTQVPNTAIYKLSFDLFIPEAVPEPGNLLILAMGAFGLIVLRKRV